MILKTVTLVQLISAEENYLDIKVSIAPENLFFASVQLARHNVICAFAFRKSATT